jgi:hypothetical protein
MEREINLTSEAHLIALNAIEEPSSIESWWSDAVTFRVKGTV